MLKKVLSILLVMTVVLTMALQFPSSSKAASGISLGDREVIYESSPYYLDGPCPTMKNANGGYDFYQLGRWQKENYKFNGSLNDPFGSLVWKKTDPGAAFWDFNGWSSGTAWAYPWIQTIYKVSSTEWIGFLHVEKHTTNPPQNNNKAYFSAAIGYSNNAGESWTFCGEIVQPYYRTLTSTGHNMGGHPVLVKNDGGSDYFYMYFNEWTNDTTEGVSVARAKVSDVISAARNKAVGTWNKYNGGSWSQNGMTGIASILINGGDSHDDVQYNSALGKYLMLSTTGTGLELFESTDGVNWTNSTVIANHASNQWCYYGFFVGEGSDDGFTHSGGFYVYWAEHNDSFGDNGRLCRRYVSTDGTFPVTNYVKNPGFESNGVGTENPLEWAKWTNGNDNASYTETNQPRSGTFNLAHWKSTAYQAYTYQEKTGLANGLYTMKAWVRSGGGQINCYLTAKDFGGTEMTANLPTTSTYTQISIPNINVTNGRCTIGLWSNANAGNWATMDDVEFYKQ